MNRSESLYVISYLGQDRFVWATSAAEARSRMARAMQSSSPPGHLVSGSVTDSHAGSGVHAARRPASDR
jgi:hypothetical protein